MSLLIVIFNIIKYYLVITSAEKVRQLFTNTFSRDHELSLLKTHLLAATLVLPLKMSSLKDIILVV